MRLSGIIKATGHEFGHRAANYRISAHAPGTDDLYDLCDNLARYLNEKVVCDFDQKNYPLYLLLRIQLRTRPIEYVVLLRKLFQCPLPETLVSV